ncbi:MAG: autotransporter-associated beta strand repeat-containing protein, partial [Thermoguttaceae bacterium]
LEELAANALSANSNLVLDSGATLELHDNSATINALVGAGSVVNSFVAHTDTLTVGAANGSGAFFGTISSGATLNFVKNGTGTQVLSGVNAYTGTTTINAGVLALSGNGQISTSSQIVNNSIFLIADDVASHTVGAITGTGTTQLNDGAQLTATSIVQGTLNIGVGTTLTIAPSGTASSMASVPEPSTLALLGIGAISLLACTWRRQKQKQFVNNG